MGSLDVLCLSCSKTCTVGPGRNRDCTSRCSFHHLRDLRIGYLGDPNKRALTDRERAKDIVDRLTKAKREVNGNINFIFKVGEHDLCFGAYLRLLGVMNDVEESKGPGQWLRLAKGVKSEFSSDKLISKQNL